MTFMVVDTDNYDVLLGLDLLIKIGAIIDVEQGLIQVRRGPGTDVEVLPLTMVNLIQRSDPEYDVYNKGTTGKSVPTNLEANDELLSWCALASSPSMTTQEPESETNSNEESDEESQQGSSIEIESEFGDTGLEILVSSEGPQQILQITLQNQANEVMKEELSDADDYADWIRWAADGEHCKQNPSGAANVTRKSVLLQVQQIEVLASSSTVKKEITEDLKGKGRWKDISQKLRIDQGLDKLKRPLLWKLLDRYQDVFAWNKGELGCCTVGEHSIDTQGFPPCRVTP
ncbi:unnamed protein product [Sphagnum jensenii]|uniref:Uncharacterized protein n=1 Tax=Sphagnum jensenii TaxID=128206 RepID=A0ABP1A0V6_9BRYO